jgi:AraC-like DNA-binding protein
MHAVQSAKAAASPAASSARTWERLIQSSVVRQFQMAFSSATGLPVTLVPVVHHPGPKFEHAPEPDSGFCIDGCMGPSSGRFCLHTLQGAERRAVEHRQNVQFECPAGLMKVLVPVWIGKEHLGNVMVGPFSLDSLDTRKLDQMRRRLKKLGLENETDRLQVTWKYSPVVGRDKAGAASELVKLFAQYLSESANSLCLEEAAQESSLLQRVEDCLEEFQDDSVESRDVARRLELSPCHFCKLFKEQTGMTFSEYRVIRRVEKARRLLLDSTLRISEVAHACGFGSLPYFIRAFRRHQGCSPSEYRAARRA